ncbi:unnamed protein product, partial [Polarella glacialis]
VVAATTAISSSTLLPSEFGLPEDVCIAPLEPPEARFRWEEQHRLEVDQVLFNFWHEASGFGIVTEEAEAIQRAALQAAPAEAVERSSEVSSAPWSDPWKASTYGEVTVLGLRQLGRALGLDESNGSTGLTFMDL